MTPLSAFIQSIELPDSSNWTHIPLHVRSLAGRSVSCSKFLHESVIKSRLQAGSPSTSKYKSSLDGLRRILREEGVEGLYKGIGSKLLQSVLTAAILFAVQRRIFELSKSVSYLRRS